MLTVTHAVRAKVQKKKGVLENSVYMAMFVSDQKYCTFFAFVKDPASSDDITGMGQTKLVESLQRLMGEGGLLILKARSTETLLIQMQQDSTECRFSDLLLSWEIITAAEF